MTTGCFVICEDDSAVSLSLAAQAVRMSAGHGGEVSVVVLHGEGKGFAVCGISHIYVLGLPEEYGDETELAVHLADWFSDRRPGMILVNATVRLRALMPVMAARLGCGLTADCTGLEMLEDGSLLQVRPALGGNVTASIVSRTWPQMATVRPGIFPEVCGYNAGTVGMGTGSHGDEIVKTERLQFDLRPLVKCLAFHKSEKRNTLSGAGIIVAGGAGIGSREGFALLEKLAGRLGGCLGATRSAVNLGYAPYSCQIGQTGQVVRPGLYLAVGISGAVQHLAGMSGAGTVIAINSDRHAPIFDYADYGLVGDWKRIVEQLLENQIFNSGRGDTDEL